MSLHVCLLFLYFGYLDVNLCYQCLCFSLTLLSFCFIVNASDHFVLLKDDKLQDVLGHFQKDFEGGVSAENLGK